MGSSSSSSSSSTDMIEPYEIVWDLPHNKALKVVNVKLCKREIWLINHWAVLVMLSDDTWLTIQYDCYAGILVNHSIDYETAKFYTRTPVLSKPRICDYGAPNRIITLGDLEKELMTLKENWDYYIIVFHDCQNFARDVIGWLTNKWVGIFPIEDGN